MQKRLAIFLGISLCLCGCVDLNKDRLSEFPSEPQWSIYAEGEPVIVCNEDDTYTIPYKMMDNCAKEHIYLRLIKEWRTKNKVQ